MRASPHGAPRERFTLDGSDALERRLAESCTEVAAAVRAVVPPAKLEGLVLGGGYGRGEGGVLRGDGEDLPYNDLEFYLFLRGPVWLNERRFAAVLHKAAAELAPVCGVETELKVISSSRLRHAPVSMFYYDLVAGHRTVIGDEELFTGCEHHGDPGRIPLSEATRLLMNRGSGLLFSAELLERERFGPEEADFVGRNLAKAHLALGDVVLATFGRYHWSCLERHQRLQQLAPGPGLPHLGTLCEHHKAGVAFKLHPVRSAESRETLTRRHAELVRLAEQLWLWLESKRLQTEFASVQEYARSSINKCPETGRLKNHLINWRTFGVGAFCSARSGRYPRERLLESLALLLFARESLTAADLAVLERGLGLRARSFAESVTAYRALWNRFN